MLDVVTRPRSSPCIVQYTFRGNTCVPDPISSGTSTTVRFYTDSSVTYPGFQLRYSIDAGNY